MVAMDMVVFLHPICFRQRTLRRALRVQTNHLHVHLTDTTNCAKWNRNRREQLSGNGRTGKFASAIHVSNFDHSSAVPSIQLCVELNCRDEDDDDDEEWEEKTKKQTRNTENCAWVLVCAARLFRKHETNAKKRNHFVSCSLMRQFSSRFCFK